MCQRSKEAGGLGRRGEEWALRELQVSLGVDGDADDQEGHGGRSRLGRRGNLVSDLLCLRCWWDNQVETASRQLAINS